ncbi:Maf-like protein [Hymenobacter glaciei]|uniref:dTTP/UTP pyrophosphatase n=1 Tax=Hymenobacter glaciei TaxID=877209 RepID=A0ABP7TBU1_9BACT
MKLILASNSPRRRQLLTELGLTYEIRLLAVDEEFPPHLHRAEVAEFLAARKAAAYVDGLAEDELLITADTIVCLENEVLNKPVDRADAQAMLGRLQGRAHDVFTGVCLRTGDGRQVVFSDQTTVHFRALTSAEIDHYIDTCQPYDKAGSYGAQDWLGMAAIDRLEGSYFNVMGLPTHRVWAELEKLGATQR